MKKIRIFAVFILFALILTLMPGDISRAYTPQYSTVKVGLNSSQSSARPQTPYVTLTNSSEFYIGYYNSSRVFERLYTISAATVKVAASGGTVTVTSGSGTTLYSRAGSLAVVPKAAGYSGTSYTLPSASYGTSYSYYGGFEFTCGSGGGTMTAVNYVDIESYVKCVVPYEAIASWNTEALKAQALCARTYAAYNMNKHAAYGYDVCSTTNCQSYKGVYTDVTYADRVNAAVSATAGEYILSGAAPINAVYHASSGGATESSVNVWGGSISYLVGVTDLYEATPSAFQTSINCSAQTVYNTMKAAHGANFSLKDIAGIDCEYTAMGNIRSITFRDSAGTTKIYSGETCRTSVASLFVTYPSQRFSITGAVAASSVIDDPEEDMAAVEADSGDSFFPSDTQEEDRIPATEIDAGAARAGDGDAADIQEEAGTAGTLAVNTYTIACRGYGHNVGMSQYGAQGMARAGFTYDEILKYYYTGVTIAGSGGGENATPFTDVSAGDWHYPAVAYVYANGLFEGTSGTTFSPDSNMTRGQFATVLGRLAGVNDKSYALAGTVNASSVNFRSGPGTTYPVSATLQKGAAVTVIGVSGDWYQVISGGATGYVYGSYVTVSKGTFSDVTAGSYYTGYIEWAASKGIVDGYTDGTFRPERSMTREEMCQILYNYCRAMGITLNTDSSVPDFADWNSVSSWAQTAVQTLQRAGVVSGVGDNTFAPQSTTARAQVAQLLMNFCEM